MAKKQFKAESKRLLDLMIGSIYTHKEIFLREIISNASDAIDKMCYTALTDPSVGMSRGDFSIRITPDKEARTITVSDNGIGMTREELDSNLGVIAKSGSFGFKSGLSDEQKNDNDIDIIGQFGVGFYSAFMVSQKVVVISRAWGSDTGAKWESTGADGYTISDCEKDSVGTDIIMYLKEDTSEENYSKFLESTFLRRLIKKYSDYIRYPIIMPMEKHRPTEEKKLDEKGNQITVHETYYVDETVNSMIPLWNRSKSEASDEDCAAFYKEKFFDSEDPLKVIRVNAEGAVSYRALLFIPSKAPYNYYTKEYEAGLQLYSSGVMIMESCSDLLPECFRFVKGVVDSQDLSLNISREMLQHDRQVRIIANSLEKRIKSELKKMMTDEPEKYDKFFSNFGLQLKYGIVNNFGAKKDLLSDLMVFYSAKEGKPISLADYVSAMPEEQNEIYYACGETVAKTSMLPQTELVRERGFDILFFTDEVDEFVANILENYSGKPFKSVNANDLDLQSDEEKKELEEKVEGSRDLLAFVRDTLNGQVVDVVLSHKLKTAPSCLSARGEITLDMEKYFSAVPNESDRIKADRVLELNGEHKTFAALADAYATDKDKAAKYAQLLYYQALLLADMPVDDPLTLTNLISDLIAD